MKKLFAIAFLSCLALSCKKDLTSINVNPKVPTQVPSGALFTSAQRNLANLLTSTNVNSNIFRLIVQYWTETTYTDESNFDLATRQIPRQVWNGLYRDVLGNIREAKRLIAADATAANTKKNQLAIAEIMEVYSWYYLVTTFGNIPYTQALNINTIQPKYDDQKTIYFDLLSRLDAAIANLSPSAESFGSSDLLYGGDVAAWKKFANTFKLKMGLTIADADNAKAKTVVESAVAAGVFTASSDDAIFRFLSAPPNTNPVWVDLVQSGRKDFVVTSTLINRLKALNDPRLSAYATSDAAGGFSGGTPGASNNYATFSKPSTTVTQPDFPAVLLSYSETEFFLAEAVQRGYNVGGTALQHYNAAVTTSIKEWGGSAADATAYLAQPSVAFDAVNWKQRIGEQKWIALYNRGWDEWIEFRRLDFPALVKPPTALSAIPVRFTYPVPEQNVNTSNYKEAAAAIGGDLVTTKLFWDKF